jgi:hypothetical protein
LRWRRNAIVDQGLQKSGENASFRPLCGSQKMRRLSWLSMDADQNTRFPTNFEEFHKQESSTIKQA